MSLLIVPVVGEIGACSLGGREAVCKSPHGGRTGESAVATRSIGPLALESVLRQDPELKALSLHSVLTL